MEVDVDGHYWVTRAAATVLIVRLLGWEQHVREFTVDAPFTDVTAEMSAAGFITLAKNQGIIQGRPDGSFGPLQRVKPDEVKLILARIVRGAPSLTLDSADDALRKVGVNTYLSCSREDAFDMWQLLILTDRTWSVPLYGRF